MKNSTDSSSGVFSRFVSRIQSRGHRMIKFVAVSGLMVMGAYSANAQLAGGTYTINSGAATGGTNYNNFTDAALALGSGILGDVTFNVVAGSGPYTERLILPNIPGTGPDGIGGFNYVTFNGNGNTLQYAATSSTARSTVFFNGMDYVILDSLTIKTTGTSYGWGIHFYNQSNNNIVRNCTIDCGTSTSSNFNGVIMSGSLSSYWSFGNSEDLTFEDNTFEGGYHGARIYGAGTSNYRSGYTFTGNTFSCYYYGVYFYYTEDLIVHDNLFTKDASFSSNFGYNCYIGYSSNIDVQRNLFQKSGFAGLYMRYVNYYNAPTSNSTVANNIVEGEWMGTSTRYGIYMYRVDDLDYVYNSINISPAGSGTLYGVYYYYSDASVQNNSFRFEGTGTTNLVFSFGSTGTFNYNNFYSENTGARYYWSGTYYYSWANFLSGSSTNANSLFTDPDYTSDTDLFPLSATLDGNATPVGVTTDYTGATRNATTPDIGAFEYTPPQNDAGVTTLIQPVAVCPDTNTIVVLVKNAGALPLTSFDVYYSVLGGTYTGITQGPVSVSGVSIIPGGDTAITLSSAFIMAGNTAYTINAWTSNPNNTTDDRMSNDTLTIDAETALNGVYTINPTGSGATNYTSFTDAITALNTYGVCDHVTFDVTAATYNEQVVMGSVIGASDAATITFHPDPANTSPVELEWNSTSSANNYTLMLDGSDWVTFDDITIKSLNTSYATTVYLNNDATNNTFMNCDLTAPTGATSWPGYNVQIYGADAEYNTFENNNIANGYYGIYAYGWGGSTTNLPDGNKLIGNTITESYYYGAYWYYQDNSTFNDNVITTTNAYRFGRAVYGYMFYSNGLDFIGNSINWPNNYYGVYIYMGGTAENHATIANNSMHIGDSNTVASTTYGLYFYGGFADIVYNTIVAEGTAGYALYVRGGLNKLHNNIMLAANSSLSSIFVNGSYALIASDYNAFSGDGPIAQGSNTLTDWQNNTGFDANSIEPQDLFTNFDSLRTCNDDLVGAGTPLDIVTDDIDDDGRSLTAPTIGADEYVSPGGFTLGDDFLLCPGDTVSIGQEINGATYAWTTGATTGVIEVTTPGTYGVTVTTGCGTGDGELIIGDATPTANFTSVASFLTHEFTNTSINGDTYMWDFGDGSSSTDENPTHAYAENGSYEVCLTVDNDCGTHQECKTITFTVGVEDLSLENSISIQPNPATNFVNVEFNGVNSDNITIELLNIQGKALFTNQLVDFDNNTVERIDVSDFSKGVYFVRITSDSEVMTERVVVQ